MKTINIALLAAVLIMASYRLYQYSNRLQKADNIVKVVPIETIEYTCALIKPDAVAAGHTDKILQMIKDKGLVVKEMVKKELSRAEAEQFYAVHRERPFYTDLVTYISSGPLIALKLEGKGAVLQWRELMGATNPLLAAEGTVRKLFGTTIQENAVHGSDSAENAVVECNQFFEDVR